MSGLPDLHVNAAGLCCSLGYHLDAAVCALRANMDHFRESAFYSQGGDPVQVASLPEKVYGAQRLQRWVEHAVQDCLSTIADPAALFDERRSAVVILVADAQRPSSEGDDPAEAVRAALERLAARYGVDAPAPAAYVIRHGRAGLVAGLRQARAALDAGKAQVLLVGVDSLLNAADINFYLQEERLFVPGNTDGFVPGEAAAALVLGATPAPTGGIRIAGLGSANERGTLDGSVPNRSEGLTAAIREACAEAQVAPGHLQFRLSDQNGEHFYTRDATNAITRVMAGTRQPAFLTLADKLGDIGAATGPAMLAWLSRDLHHPQRRPGHAGLLHLANDAGLRNAVVVHAPKE
ncbi:hypothetical protein [Pseudoduganella buxea]|uniref:3-oxoacyl-ACP synthase n=1 Tax=Pseudoduganella buxea TaxID=1949069 RepID=A0A6I3SUT6_9BURK|nr:hypothetical protein [Pseudoduganella buxea]MTV52396.1 hypothetical protein [Pseudoduganella buxea]GGC17871.1 3-oxoacyl-ACP synthase [Pseudoduganella buxea]